MAHLEKMALVFNLNVNSHKVTVLKKVWDLEQCHLGEKIGVVINQFKFLLPRNHHHCFSKNKPRLA